MSILLTLSAGSLRRNLSGKSAMNMLDVPKYVMSHMRLHGLNIPTSLLSGWPLSKLDKLRDRADKAGCPCLVLIEDAPLQFGHANESKREKAIERVNLLATAASRLGCNALAIHCDAPDTPDALDLVAGDIQDVMFSVERMDLNILIAPHQGLTYQSDTLTDLIKRIGGFRIGSLPSFGAAAAAGEGDPTDSLRKLAPYAGAIQATIVGFSKNGEHSGFDLSTCVTAIRSVGFLNTLAIDYVGNSDPIPMIEKARDALQAALESS